MFTPAIESYVKDGNLVVRADVPGLEPKDLDVSILGNVLTVKGERKSEKRSKKEDYLRREVSYGAFRTANEPAGRSSRRQDQSELQEWCARNHRSIGEGNGRQEGADRDRIGKEGRYLEALATVASLAITDRRAQRSRRPTRVRS